MRPFPASPSVLTSVTVSRPSGVRASWWTILSHLSAGDSAEDLLEVFPDLEREDVLAALAYASMVVHMKGTVLKAA
jgi:hypothetical protein